MELLMLIWMRIASFPLILIIQLYIFFAHFIFLVDSLFTFLLQVFHDLLQIINFTTHSKFFSLSFVLTIFVKLLSDLQTQLNFSWLE